MYLLLYLLFILVTEVLLYFALVTEVLFCLILITEVLFYLILVTEVWVVTSFGLFGYGLDSIHLNISSGFKISNLCFHWISWVSYWVPTRSRWGPIGPKVNLDGSSLVNCWPQRPLWQNPLLFATILYI